MPYKYTLYIVCAVAVHARTWLAKGLEQTLTKSKQASLLFSTVWRANIVYHVTWHDTVAPLAAAYDRRCTEEKRAQKITNEKKLGQQSQSIHSSQNEADVQVNKSIAPLRTRVSRDLLTDWGLSKKQRTHLHLRRTVYVYAVTESGRNINL